MLGEFLSHYLKTEKKGNGVNKLLLTSILFVLVLFNKVQAFENAHHAHPGQKVKTATQVRPSDLTPEEYRAYLEDPLYRSNPDACREKYKAIAMENRGKSDVAEIQAVKRSDKFVRIFGLICDGIAIGCQSAVLKHCQLETKVDPNTHETHMGLNTGCEALASISLAASVLKLGSIYWESKYDGCCLPDCKAVCRMSWASRGKSVLSVVGFVCNTVTLATLGKVDLKGLVSGALISYGGSILTTAYQFFT
jgi:hypothetical protein